MATVNIENITTNEMIPELKPALDFEENMQSEYAPEVKYLRGFNGCLPSRSLNSTPINFRARYGDDDCPADNHQHFQPTENDLMAANSEENLFLPFSSFREERNVFSALSGSSSSISSSCSEMEMSWGSTMSEIMRARKKEKSVHNVSRSLDSSPVHDQGFLYAVWIGKDKKQKKKLLRGKDGSRRRSEYQRLDSTSSTDSGWSFGKEDELALSRTSSISSLSSGSELDFSWGSTMSNVLRARGKRDKKSPNPVLKFMRDADGQMMTSRSLGSTPLLLTPGEETDEMHCMNPLDVQLRERASQQSTRSMSDLECNDAKPGLINILKARHNHLRY